MSQYLFVNQWLDEGFDHNGWFICDANDARNGFKSIQKLDWDWAEESHSPNTDRIYMTSDSISYKH